MKIPFPQSIPYKKAAIGAAVVGIVQLLEGTDPWFTMMSVVFTLAWVTAFNLSGGMRFPSGAYIFANGIQTLILPSIVKVVLGEAGQTNLRAADRILEVYVGGMLAMLIAALVSRTLRPRVSLLQKVAPVKDLRSAYYGSFLISLALRPIFAAFPSREDGSFGAFLNQADKFPVLMLLMGVAYTIRRSGGKRTLSVPLACLIIFTSIQDGLLTFSKEAFLQPLFAWILVMAVLRFELKWTQVIFLVFLGYMTYAYIVPYCQVGRNFDPEGRSQIEVAGYLLTHIDEARDKLEESTSYRRDDMVHYYNVPTGLLDRMETTSIDSALVEVTDREGQIGYEPMLTALANFVPHVLWKSKPRGLWGNQYAHQVGVLGQDDFSTGISFSPSADAYHEGGFLGVLLVETLVLMLGFLLLDSLVGDVQQNIAGLIILVVELRYGSDGLLYGTIISCAQPMFGTFVAALFCAYLFPIVSQLIRVRQSDQEGPVALALPPARA